MKKLLLCFAAALAIAPVHFLGGCGSTVDNGIPSPDGGTSSEAGGSIGGGSAANGAQCQTSTDCGSRNCDATTKQCAPPASNCKAPDDACAATTDCCSGSCVAGKCGAKQCVADLAACTTDGECCGGKCDGGKCTALSTTCKTSGNPCAASTDCCSTLCKDGFCTTPSFCAQNGDACAADTDCCGGSCTKAAGATLGLCSTVSAAGAGNCTTAGTVCSGATTGGSLPPCGGDCCSRSCRPYAATGVLVCQPPTGCHPTGELCQQDADCCGSPGSPGSTKDVGNGPGTNVHCSKAAGAMVGRCDQGQQCSPAGSICRLATNSCDATDRCCSGDVQQHPLDCKQDALGIPRCTVANDYDCTKSGPPPAGTACASGADCCGQPCVPNAAGTGLVCAGSACVAAGGACTTTADCCAGSPCNLAAGTTKGTCGASAVTPPGGTAPPPSTAPGATNCAQYGQVCNVAGDCCNGVPCTGGRCEDDIIVK